MINSIIFTYIIYNVLLQIPAEIMEALEPIKDNEEAVKAYGIHLGTEMCKKIMASGIRTIHLYTLNMEKSALAILAVGIHNLLSFVAFEFWQPAYLCDQVK